MPTDMACDCALTPPGTPSVDPAIAPAIAMPTKIAIFRLFIIEFSFRNVLGGFREHLDLATCY